MYTSLAYTKFLSPAQRWAVPTKPNAYVRSCFPLCRYHPMKLSTKNSIMHQLHFVVPLDYWLIQHKANRTIDIQIQIHMFQSPPLHPFSLTENKMCPITTPPPHHATTPPPATGIRWNYLVLSFGTISFIVSLQHRWHPWVILMIMIYALRGWLEAPIIDLNLQCFVHPR